MERFPAVDGPCPYKDRLSSVMDGNHCRMCQRDVHDLDAMGGAEREAFLASRSGEVCVRYTLDPRKVAAALAIGSLVAAPLPLAAQEAPAPASDNASSAQAAVDDYVEDYIIVGAVHTPKNPRWVKVKPKAKAAKPALPVVEEEDKADESQQPRR